MRRLNFPALAVNPLLHLRVIQEHELEDAQSCIYAIPAYETAKTTSVMQIVNIICGDGINTTLGTSTSCS